MTYLDFYCSRYQALILREQGFLTSLNFRQYEETSRILKIGLSKNVDIEHTFTGGVNSLDIEESENRYILSGCSDGSVYIHDLYNFSSNPAYMSKCVSRIRAKSKFSHKNGIECVSWFPQGNGLFVTTGGDRKIKLWDTNRMIPVEEVTSTGDIHHHQCSPYTRSQIAVASSTVELLDLRTGNKSHQMKGAKKPVMAVSWSPREAPLLVGGAIDGQVNMWDVRSAGGPLLTLDYNNTKSAHAGRVIGLSFTPDGLHLLTFGADQQLRLWNSTTGKALTTNYGRIKTESFRHVQFDVENYIFIPSKGIIRVIDVMTGLTASMLCGHLNHVNCCIYRRDYHQLYTGGRDRNILVWTPEYDEENTKGIPQTADAWSSDDEQVS